MRVGGRSSSFAVNMSRSRAWLDNSESRGTTLWSSIKPVLQVMADDETRSKATRTPSTTSSTTRPRCWTRSTSSNSAPKPSTRFAGECSKPSTATAAAQTTRSTGSARSCAPTRNASPTGNTPDSRPRSSPTNTTTRSTSHGSAPSNCAPHTTRRA